MNAPSYALDVRYIHTEFERQRVRRDDMTVDATGCPVCGAFMHPLIEVRGAADAVVVKDFCPSCSYVHFRTLPSENWIRNYYASRWDTSRSRPKSLEDDPRAYQNSIDLLERHAPGRESRIFDLGAGYGVFMHRCRGEGYGNLTGIEASPRRAERCRALGFEVCVSTAEVMAEEAEIMARGPFDVVHSSHVVEHVYDLRATMTQLRKLLKPGGLAIVIVPNVLSENLLVVSQGVFHIRNFTAESLAHLFSAFGFEIVEQNTGDSLEIVARMGDLPSSPPSPDASAASRLRVAFAARLAAEFGVTAPADGAEVNASIFVSRPPRRQEVWPRRRFPVFSKPWILSLVFGSGFEEAPVFGPQGKTLRLLAPRNLLFKLRRRLFGVGRLEIAATLEVRSGSVVEHPALTIRYPDMSVPILLK